MKKSRCFFFIFAALAFLLLTSCQDNLKPGTAGSGNDRFIMSTLYQQQSAEAEALYFQAYFLARVMVESELSRGEPAKPRAIITDIDETVLDNSPYQAQCILEGINYPERWDAWCELANARPLPGSQQFLSYAADKGIEIFYVTNRKEHLKEVTILNLKRHLYPYADEAHLLMRKTGSSKEERRKKIASEYRVILLLGDNIEDFTRVFEDRPVAERKELADRLKESFGRQFIMFPNPMYGSWEQALYYPNPDTTAEAKADMRIRALEGF